MKYKQLTKEQFLALHKEFAEFLATQQLDAKEWESIKENKPDLVEEELNLFSDLVWEDVLQKIKYLEHFSEQSINLFKCEDAKISRIVVQTQKLNFNFLNDKDYQWFINHTTDDAFEFLKGEKIYAKDRNLELFDLIQKGSVISKGELFENVYVLINR